MTKVTCPIVRVRAGRCSPHFAKYGQHYIDDHNVIGKLKDGDLAVLLPADVPLPPYLIKTIKGLAPALTAAGTLQEATLTAPVSEGWGLRDGKSARVLRLYVEPDPQRSCYADFAEGECAAAFLGLTPDTGHTDGEAAATVEASPAAPSAPRVTGLCPVVRLRKGRTPPQRQPLRHWLRAADDYYPHDYAVVDALLEGELAIVLPPGVPLPLWMRNLMPVGLYDEASNTLSQPVLMPVPSNTRWVTRMQHSGERLKLAWMHIRNLAGEAPLKEGDCAAALLGLPPGAYADALAASITLPVTPVPTKVTGLCPVVRVRAGQHPNQDPLSDWRRDAQSYYVRDFPHFGAIEAGHLAIVLPPGVPVPQWMRAEVQARNAAIYDHATNTLKHPMYLAMRDKEGRALREGRMTCVRRVRRGAGGDALFADFAEGECAAQFLGFMPPAKIVIGVDLPNVLMPMLRLLDGQTDGTLPADLPLTGSADQPQLRFDAIEIYRRGDTLLPALTWRGKVVYRYPARALHPHDIVQLKNLDGTKPFSIA